MKEFFVNQKVWVSVADTSPLGGGRHRGRIENIVRDMFDGSILYLIKTKGGAIIPAREGAIEAYKQKSKNQ